VEDRTMQRCTLGLLVTLAVGVLVAPAVITAQPQRKIPRVGVLEPGS
jgi:hypothetical protein